MLECTGCGSRQSIEEIRGAGFLSCCPERDMKPVEIYLREIDAGTDTACWVICNKIDPGAIRFEAATQ